MSIHDKFARRVAQCGIDPRKIIFCTVGVGGTDNRNNNNENKKEGQK